MCQGELRNCLSGFPFASDFISNPQRVPMLQQADTKTRLARVQLLLGCLVLFMFTRGSKLSCLLPYPKDWKDTQVSRGPGMCCYFATRPVVLPEASPMRSHRFARSCPRPRIHFLPQTLVHVCFRICRSSLLAFKEFYHFWTWFYFEGP